MPRVNTRASTAAAAASRPSPYPSCTSDPSSAMDVDPQWTPDAGPSGGPEGHYDSPDHMSVCHESSPKSIDSPSISSSRSQAITEFPNWYQYSGGNPDSMARSGGKFSGPSYTKEVRALRLRANRSINGATGRGGRPTQRSTRALISSIYRPTPGSRFASATHLPIIPDPPLFTNQIESLKYYHHVSKHLQQGIIQNWEPHVMSVEEIDLYNITTLHRLERIRALEEEQVRYLPRRDNHLEQALFIARLDYRGRMYRTFRLHDLPTEIIHNIFRFVCWSAGNPDTNVRWRVNISSVSRFWRNNLLSDGTIWSAIWFKDTPDFGRSFLWLDRARQAPVDIRINDSVNKPWTLEMTSYVIDKLFLKLPSIRILIIVLHDWDPILYILQALCRAAYSRVPLILERLEIHRSGPAYIQTGKGYPQNFYNEPISLFGGVSIPSFKYLSTNGCHVDWNRSNFANLTTLDIRRIPLERAPTLQRFRELLINSPRITKLVLDGAGPRWPGEQGNKYEPIMMAELKTIILGDFSLTYGTYLLSIFRCPAVIDLTLMNLIGEDYAPLYSAMTNMMPNVLSLTLYGAETPNIHPNSMACIAGWLKTMPKVAFMRLKNVTANFLGLFLWDGDKMVNTILHPGEKFEHVVCPALNIIETHGISPALIKQWGIDRGALGIPIKKIYLGSTGQKSLTREEINTIRQGVCGPVVIMNYPGKPVEERELLGE